MNTTAPTKRPLRTVAEVLAEVDKKAPTLSPHLFIDREWIWYCGPSLQMFPKLRAALAEIGFRFSRKGHPMPDGQTGSWGHSCAKPTWPRRHHKPDTNGKRAVPDQEEAPPPAPPPNGLAALAELFG